MAQAYRVTGMTCGGCARAVENAIKAESPEAKVTVDLAAASVTVDGADEEQVRRAVDSAGFTYLGAV